MVRETALGSHIVFNASLLEFLAKFGSQFDSNFHCKNKHFMLMSIQIIQPAVRKCDLRFLCGAQVQIK